jgi:hypothetical protein
MPERFLFTHRESNPEEVGEKITNKEVAAFLGSEFFDGEKELPKEAKKYLPIMRFHIIRKQGEYGLKQNENKDSFGALQYVQEYVAKEVDLDRIHYMSPDAYRRSIPGETIPGSSYGFYESSSQAIFLREREALASDETETKKSSIVEYTKFFRMIQHESLHMVSYEVDYLGKSGKIKLYRQGYMVFNPKHNWERFRGLNEAVIETANTGLFYDEIPDLMEAFPNSKREDWMRGRASYQEYRTVLSDIIQNIAEADDRDPSDVWKDFEKGLFTGRMKHLSNIDRVYGSGSLRLLASMGSYEGDTVKGKPEDIPQKDWVISRQDIYMRYFQEPLPKEERITLAQEVLSDREYRRFLTMNDFES